MNKYKVAVYAISKNEEKFVGRWVESMKEADEIYVCDTGSDDNTVEVLKSLEVKVKSIKTEPWRFDKARNESLNFVDDDVDICVCTDLDEVFDKGWRKDLEQHWNEKATRARYKYIWNFESDGTPGTTFWGEKIHSRHGFEWIHPVHEILKYKNGKESEVILPTATLNHHADDKKSRSQYLPLLELSVREDPDDDRNMHYLGREYMFHGDWDKCIATLKKHLEMPSSQWRDERSASMRYIARAYRSKGDEYTASQWHLRAIAEAPYLREPYVEAAQLAYKQENWEKVLFLLNDALKIKTKPMTYICEPFCWNSLAWDMLSIAAYKLGLNKKAIDSAEQALRLSPDDKRIADNINVFKAALKETGN